MLASLWLRVLIGQYILWSHTLAPGFSALVSCAAAVQASGQALADTVADMVDGTDRDRGLPLRNDVLGLVRGGTASLVGLGELDMSAKAWPFRSQPYLAGAFQRTLASVLERSGLRYVLYEPFIYLA